ncbi:MAG TPA: radical SAM protein [Myxococcota bacterium]|nr:radical SAM protein [Myxococcota bacterium]
MKDRFGRTIDYLRISVTDRCDLRCVYCMPEEGVRHVPSEKILTFEEIREVAGAAAAMGVTKIRLTGGEPLVRRGIVDLVGMLADIPGVTDLAMSTNATRLAEYAADLAAAGLMRVNVSLDSLRPEVFKNITRGGDLDSVLAGIDAAELAGLSPIKLNCVVQRSSDEPDAHELAAFGRERGFEVRFIRVMNFARGEFYVVEGGSGGDCPRCNRLRLSSDGLVHPCLFSDLAFSVRELGAAEALRRAVDMKPQAGGPCTHNWIRAVGG